MERIAIIGLGLIGGSIGMALKKAKIRELEIVGHDMEPEVAGKARKKGAVDRYDWSLIGAVKDANMVIVAVPVMAVKSVMEAIAPCLPEGCVVTDTASSKGPVMDWAREILPPSVHFVGGHPMAGKETPGIEGADADLFQKAAYCVIPSPTAASSAVEAVTGLARLMGANPFFVDAAEHDGFVAAVSHLPLVLSTALVTSTTRSPGWREMSRLAASGYRDVSRLASGDPVMGHDICVSNKENINRWIDVMIGELQRFKALIDKGGEDLALEFGRAQMARDKWVRGSDDSERDASMTEIGGTSERMMSLFVGQRLARLSSQVPGADRRAKKR